MQSTHSFAALQLIETEGNACFPTRPAFFSAGKKQKGREKGGDEMKQPKTGALKLGIYYGSPRVSLLTLAHKHTEMCSGARILYKSPFSASNVL